MGVESVLMSVISMLNDPNIESPANIDASVQFRDDREAFNKKVRILTTKSLEDVWGSIIATNRLEVIE